MNEKYLLKLQQDMQLKNFTTNTLQGLLSFCEKISRFHQQGCHVHYLR